MSQKDHRILINDSFHELLLILYIVLIKPKNINLYIVIDPCTGNIIHQKYLK